MSQETKARIQWQPIIELAVVMVTILGTTIPLYLHTDSKMHEMSQQMNAKTDRLYEMFIDLVKKGN